MSQTTEEQTILSLKVNTDDAIYGILRCTKSANALKEKIKELDKKWSELDETQRKEMGTSDQHIMRLSEMKEELKSVQTEQREFSKIMQQNMRLERDNLKNYEATHGSLKTLRTELSLTIQVFDSLSRAERNGAEGMELKNKISALTKEIKEAEQETQRFQRSVGSYEDSIRAALGVNSDFAKSIMGMTSGGRGLAGMFNEAKVAAKAFGSTLMGLLSNPAFAALAGLAGVGAAFKWFYDYNEGIEESTRLTREFLGLTGDDLKAIRDGIQATADTYGKDYKEVLEAVDVLTTQYGLNAKQSLQIVKDGFQAGADLNGDMIAKIKQYAPAFHDANIGAKELVGTIQQTRSGIFSDSGMSLIQMGSKKIREMSDKTREALDGIGISSKKVADELRNGTTTTFDVIKQISTHLKHVPQDSQEVGNVLRDVFGRQGANAGLKMIEQLDTMNVDLDKLKETTGEYGEKISEQQEASEELNNTLAALFDASEDGFGEMIIQVKTLATKGITELIKGVIKIINYFIKLYNESIVVRGGVQQIIFNFKLLWQVAKFAFNLIIDGAKQVGRSLKGISEILEGVLSGSLDKIKSGFAALGNGIVKSYKEAWGDVKNFGKAVVKDATDGVNALIDKTPIKAITIPVTTLSDTEAPDDVTPTGELGPKKGKKKKKKKEKKKKGPTAEQLAKKEMEEMRKAEDLLTQLVEQTDEERRKAIEVQYNRQIEDIRRRLNTEKDLTEKARKAMAAQIISLEKLKAKKLAEFDSQVLNEAVKREQMYIQNMLAAVEKGAKEEYDLKIANLEDSRKLEIEAAKTEVMKAEEKAKLIESIEAKYNEQKLAAYKEYTNSVHDEQMKSIEDAFKTKQLEIQLAGGENSELELLRLKMEEKQAMIEAFQMREGESIEAFNQRKMQLDLEYMQAKQAVSEKEIEIEKAKQDAVVNIMKGVQDVANAFGEDSKTLAKMSKVLALGEIAINTGVAIAKMTSAEAGKGIIGIATTAVGIASILANVAAAIKTVKSAKFARGGLVTGPGSSTSDSIPAMLSNGESVLTAQATRLFAPALSAMNQMGGGRPIIVQGGGAEIGEEFLARAVARGFAMAPRPVVSVEEINKVSRRVQVLERQATL